MLGVYTFLFGVVLRVRWGVHPAESYSDFALILFVGLIVHGIFAECVTRAPTIILSNASFVRRVVFPLEILPLTIMGAALFHGAVSLLIWFAAALATGYPLSPLAFLLPLVLVPLVLMTMGCSWFLASAGVYLRDINHVVGIVSTILLFLSPIFYRVEAVPEQYRLLIRLNPLTVIVEQTRAVLAWHSWPDWWYLLLAWGWSGLVAGLGLTWFQKTRRGFADVL
jgi:lipopolysaccharide transport system permease protein